MPHKTKSIFILLFLVINHWAPQVFAQENHFTHQDTLRGSNGPGRSNWNVLHYDISVTPDIIQKQISGCNTITFKDAGVEKMQIDLQEPMILDSVVEAGRHFDFTREGNVYWVNMAAYPSSTIRTMRFYFHGQPREAVTPPWDGGWIWKKDQMGRPFVSVACQGLGASVWYPCKDIQSDEPDMGCTLRIITPDTLVGVGNGKLISQKQMPGNQTEWTWMVQNPINNYNIVPYIGKYIHFSDTYSGLNGKLPMDYYVLDYNEEKAKKQFADAPRMMKAFEHWFGPYPFYEDGYKLVEAPHLGMEHQSAVAYGNAYKNGYLGHDRSNSGWGMKWDFIIVHESGHEWFANSITSKDIADMWIHESFTNYSEALFVEYYYGKAAADSYVQGERSNIGNDKPIIGPYGVNKEGSGDMYDKGGNLVHTIRQLFDNDKKFRNMLLKMNKTFYHQTVTTQQIEAFISAAAGKDLSKIFDLYLRSTQIPVLNYMYGDSGNLLAWWTDCNEGFNMPVKIALNNGKYFWIHPTTSPQTFKIKKMKTLELKTDPNFYVSTHRFIP